jgi:radical SAM protein with 4Fe4S-binding SPASM domain
MSQQRLNAETRLSRYVVRTHHEGREVLFDTVGLEKLPPDSSDEDLARAGMLAGQERATLWSRLTRPRRELSLTLVATWECNLRCSHCSVLGKLKRVDPSAIAPDRLERFLEQYRETVPSTTRLKLSFLGGEPLLRAEACRKLLEAGREVFAETRSSITTNLVARLEAPHLSLLAELDEILVSLDGVEEAHNRQRHPYRARFNPFRRTLDNLARLRESGLIERVSIQGAIRDDDATEAHFQEFHRTLVKLGVPYDKIRFDTVHPAEKGLEVQESYLASLRYPLLRREPCCKFRGASALVVDSDGTLYSDFYTWEPLGSLDEAPEQLIEAQRRSTRRSMPALKDQNCLSCPVIGLCWGGCVNGHLVVGDRPSAFCGQQALIDRVRQLAERGELIEARESAGAVATAAADPRRESSRPASPRL